MFGRDADAAATLIFRYIPMPTATLCDTAPGGTLEFVCGNDSVGAATPLAQSKVFARGQPCDIELDRRRILRAVLGVDVRLVVQRRIETAAIVA